MNSRTRASAPMICNEHICPSSALALSTLIFYARAAAHGEKSIAIAPVSISRQHLTIPAHTTAHIQRHCYNQRLTQVEGDEGCVRQSGEADGRCSEAGRQADRQEGLHCMLAKGRRAGDLDDSIRSESRAEQVR